MATEAPDPRTFKSWEDAFQYPIPVVRKLETQLRSSAGENREKLRSLVGTSYRDLLDTAETIIDMEKRMESVESKLARVGQNCNTRVLEKTTGNTAKMEGHKRSRDLERYTFASQLAVLENSPVVMGRLMKSEGSYLLIAKVLVISRLLHKALSQGKYKPPIVDQLRDRLGALRRRLLRRIDKRLASTTGDPMTLVESMCAYSLATSSTPTDVLRHFHHVRMEEMVKTLKTKDDLAKHGIEAMKLCLQTCQDTQAIFPRRLADSLAKLKAHPLVQDPDVRALYELDLDIHDRWISDEARNYTPWPRHDELQRPEAERLLHQWSKQSISAFLKGIKAILQRADQLKEVASLRQDLIETWIISGSRMVGVKTAHVLDDLRDTMNHQLEAIVRSRTQSLQAIVSELTTELSSRATSNRNTSLWVAVSSADDLTNGAQAFKMNIISTHQGRDPAVIRIVSKFDAWMTSVLEVKAIVKSMKETRWDDTFTDDVDDDSDDEFGADSKQTLLSDDDPRLLEEVTQEALSKSLKSLGHNVGEIIQKLAGATSVPQTTFLLRIVREIGDRIPKLRLHDKTTPLPSPFTSNLLSPLHTILAQDIINPTVLMYQKAIRKAVKGRTNSHILWEGHPPLPAQPSPSAFRFLQPLVKSMGEYGADLWAPDGVQILKTLAAENISEVWSKAFENIQALLPKAAKAGGDHRGKEEQEEKKEEEELIDNGIEGSEKEELKKPIDTETSVDMEKLKKEKLKQLLFDVLYIQRSLETSSMAPLALMERLLATIQKDSDVDEVALGRLRKNTADYWKKTYLLFALLA
ncbi:hypothetical protein P154DRAFT_497324 [Amniculicola lignicola CBS 123094]|uniref:Conserved oligomeric Golgi complex subunit 1 n=1 Tax=Amniculicola lignicola CBS 123094 TaxID=1392246 RepID=A0A6A5W7Y1_9PLEO|nr:hypothetical protein P154DRAFT_497324 [Amniculicola lignicola CBS 123094]